MSSERIINKRNGNQLFPGSIDRTWNYGGGAVGERSKLYTMYAIRYATE